MTISAKDTKFLAAETTRAVSQRLFDVCRYLATLENKYLRELCQLCHPVLFRDVKAFFLSLGDSNVEYFSN